MQTKNLEREKRNVSQYPEIRNLKPIVPQSVSLQRIIYRSGESGSSKHPSERYSDTKSLANENSYQTANISQSEKKNNNMNVNYTTPVTKIQQNEVNTHLNPNSTEISTEKVGDSSKAISGRNSLRTQSQVACTQMATILENFKIISQVNESNFQINATKPKQQNLYEIKSDQSSIFVKSINESSLIENTIRLDESVSSKKTLDQVNETDSVCSSQSKNINRLNNPLTIKTVSVSLRSKDHPVKIEINQGNNSNNLKNLSIKKNDHVKVFEANNTTSSSKLIEDKILPEIQNDTSKMEDKKLNIDLLKMKKETKINPSNSIDVLNNNTVIKNTDKALKCIKQQELDKSKTASKTLNIENKNVAEENKIKSSKKLEQQENIEKKEVEIEKIKSNQPIVNDDKKSDCDFTNVMNNLHKNQWEKIQTAKDPLAIINTIPKEPIKNTIQPNFKKNLEQNKPQSNIPPSLIIEDLNPESNPFSMSKIPNQIENKGNAIFKSNVNQLKQPSNVFPEMKKNLNDFNQIQNNKNIENKNIDKINTVNTNEDKNVPIANNTSTILQPAKERQKIDEINRNPSSFNVFSGHNNIFREETKKLENELITNNKPLNIELNDGRFNLNNKIDNNNQQIIEKNSKAPPLPKLESSTFPNRNNCQNNNPFTLNSRIPENKPSIDSNAPPAKVPENTTTSRNLLEGNVFLQKPSTNTGFNNPFKPQDILPTLNNNTLPNLNANNLITNSLNTQSNLVVPKIGNAQPQVQPNFNNMIIPKVNPIGLGNQIPTNNNIVQHQNLNQTANIPNNGLNIYNPFISLLNNKNLAGAENTNNSNIHPVNNYHQEDQSNVSMEVDTGKIDIKFINYNFLTLANNSIVINENRNPLQNNLPINSNNFSNIDIKVSIPNFNPFNFPSLNPNPNQMMGNNQAMNMIPTTNNNPNNNSYTNTNMMAPIGQNNVIRNIQNPFMSNNIQTNNSFNNQIPVSTNPAFNKKMPNQQAPINPINTFGNNSNRLNSNPFEVENKNTIVKPVEGRQIPNNRFSNMMTNTNTNSFNNNIQQNRFNTSSFSNTNSNTNGFNLINDSNNPGNVFLQAAFGSNNNQQNQQNNDSSSLLTEKLPEYRRYVKVTKK